MKSLNSFCIFRNLVSGLWMASDEPNRFLVLFQSWKLWQKHSLNFEVNDLLGNSPFTAVHVMIPKVAGMMPGFSFGFILQGYDNGNSAMAKYLANLCLLVNQWKWVCSHRLSLFDSRPTIIAHGMFLPRIKFVKISWHVFTGIFFKSKAGCLVWMPF